MAAVTVKIVRFTDNSQPGWVECNLTDAWGRQWVFEDKVPIFTTEHLDSETTYPRQGLICCQIIKRWSDESARELVTIDTQSPDHVSDPWRARPGLSCSGEP